MSGRNTGGFKAILFGAIGPLFMAGTAALIVSGSPPFGMAAWFLRGTALLAFFCAFTAGISSLFVKELSQRSGLPFMVVHHALALTSLAGMLVHAALVAILFGPSFAFLPEVTGILDLLAYGGRGALLLFILAALVGLFRAAIGKRWRTLHWMSYLAFLLATAHSRLLGSSLSSGALGLLGPALAAILLAAFVIKRLRTRKSRNASSQRGDRHLL